MTMMLLSFFLFSMLMLYFDKVLPRQHGTPLKPWFCCLPSYWHPRDPNATGSQTATRLLEQDNLSQGLLEAEESQHHKQNELVQ